VIFSSGRWRIFLINTYYQIISFIVSSQTHDDKTRKKYINYISTLFLGDSMGVRIEVMTKGSVDKSAKGLISKAPVRVYNINDDSLKPEDIGKIEKLLSDPVVDEVASDSSVLWKSGQSFPEKTHVIEMSPKPGVNDPEGQVVKKAIERTLGREIGDVSFGKQFLWNGALSVEEYVNVQKQLGNIVVNEFEGCGLVKVNWDNKKGREHRFPFHFPTVDLPPVEAFQYVDVELSDEELVKLSNDRYLALNLEEMTTVRDHYRNPEEVKRRAEVGLGPRPADAELENLAQTWSEHCIHKKLKGNWICTSDDPNDESGLTDITVDSLFTIIQKPAHEMSKKVNWLISIFEDNAGIIALNDRYSAAHKVETHNHPTGIYSFGGANTGTGGVIRDNKGTGTGQRVTSSQYGFRIPHPTDFDDIPIEMQTPARTLEGMVDGVEDYGNKMGIPTNCGQVMIDHGWPKPACIVGSTSVVEKEINGKPTHVKDIRPGYIALTLGGKVGQDGVHGATGSSQEQKAGDEKRQDVNQSVQIGAPIEEKGVFEVMDILQKLEYIKAAQDCGAGGWNSAVGELTELLHKLEKARYNIQQAFKEKGITENNSYQERIDATPKDVGLDKIASPFADQLKLEIASGDIFTIKTNGKGGAVMDLTNVLEKYKGLAGWIKLISEAQERMVVVIEPKNLEETLEICKHNNVPVMKIVEFNDTGYYHVLDQNKTINYLPIEFMHQGLPQMTIKAHWTPCQNEEPDIMAPKDLTGIVLELMSAPNIQSYDWIRTRFDHEVQGGSLIKPLVGPGKAQSDANAFRPVLTESEVIIETWGSNPWQGDIDAYHMGRNNVVDAVGRVIAAGGSLSDKDTYKITFNGNTMCPKPESDPLVAAKVIRMLKGAADAELALDAPTISGKDSTSMERKYISTKTGKEVHVKAKPELLMSAMAVIPDDSTLTTSDFKLPGDLIYVIGDTRDELGGSEYYLLHDQTGRNVPKSDLEQIKTRYTALSQAVKQGLVHSAQYVAKGGLVAALLNSSMGGDLGFKVELDSIDEGLGADRLLFSETTGRFVVTIHSSQREKFEQEMKGCYAKKIGKVRLNNEICIEYQGNNVVNTSVDVVRKTNKGDIRPGKLLYTA